MQKFLILVGLALVMMVGCSDAPKGLEDTGTIKASKAGNGDWTFDLTGLGASLGDGTEWGLYYNESKDGNGVANISVREGWDEATSKPNGKFYVRTSWYNEDTSENGEYEKEVSENTLKVTIPADSGFPFDAANAKWADVNMNTTKDGVVSALEWEGSVTNGSGEIKVVSRGEAKKDDNNN